MKTSKTSKIQRVMLATAISLIFSYNAYSSDLSTYQKSYKNSLVKIESKHKNDIAGINEKYEAHLDKEMKKAISQGNIKEHDRLLKEKEKFLSDRELPDQHKKLLNKPDQDKSMAIFSLAEKYKVALDRLKIQAAKSGNLDEARKIDQEIDVVGFVLAENGVGDFRPLHNPKTYSNKNLKGEAGLKHKNNTSEFDIIQVGRNSELYFYINVASHRSGSKDSSGNVYLISSKGKVSVYQWSPIELKKEKMPIRVNISDHVTEAGAYIVEFKYTHGLDALLINEVGIVVH